MSSETPLITSPEPWDDTAAEALCTRLGVLAGQLNVVNAQLTAALADTLTTGLWRQGAVHTPEQFAAWKLGVSPERDSDLIKIARARTDFPTIVNAFDQGELSVEQVAAATNAPAWADDQIIDIVRISTVTKLRRQMRHRNFDHDPDPDPDRAGTSSTPDSTAEPDTAADENHVSFGPTDDGRWRIRATFDLLTGQRIEAAITERRHALFTDGDIDVTWADAVADCLNRSLDTVASPSRRDHYRTWIHLDVTNGSATTTNGWHIPTTLADRLLCDGTVQPVWERDGVPFAVGRTQRIVPDRTRRIIERRDQGCRVPGCTTERFVEIHHIIHWLDGGATDPAKLISLRLSHGPRSRRGRWS